MNGPLMASVTSLETSDTLAAVAEAPYLDTPGRIETLYLAALDPPAPARGARAARCLTSSAAAPRATDPRHSPTSSGLLLNSPEFRFNH